MDWNGSSLANFLTRADLARQGIKLREGMRCVFYDEDAEDGRNGFLHCEGTVWWDDKSGKHRVRATTDFRFTPGESIDVLARFCDHEAASDADQTESRV